MCAFMSLTHNEPTEGMALFFASFGLFQVAVVLALPTWWMFGSTRLAVPVGIGIATIAVATARTLNSHANGPTSRTVGFFNVIELASRPGCRRRA